MKEAQIRRAKPEDARAIHEAHMRSIREVCVKDHGLEEIRGWGYRDFDEKQRIETIQKDAVWVIEFQGQVEGYSHLRLSENDGEKSAYIWALYLTEAVIGKGYGLTLLRLMADSARAFGSKKITLESTLTAHRFYEKFGFKDSGPLKRVEINGYPVRCFPMELHL